MLAKIDRFSLVSEYNYIGFGGHSLEEFKYIHDRFGLEKMTSIESDLEVFKRQKFNQPYSCINLINQDSKDFINEYDRRDKTIIWLDYVEPSKLRSQIEEFQQIILKLDVLDIVKITLNANPTHLATSGTASSANIHDSRIEKLKEMLGEEDLFPSADISGNMMTTPGFPFALTLILKYAANLALAGKKDIYFQPLTAFSYADGQQMMTLTGIILDKERGEEFFENTELKLWELINTNWSKPVSINIPDLTIRERLCIERLLPNSTPEEIQDKLGFKFDIKMLKTYTMFYRQSPYFSRILV